MGWWRNKVNKKDTLKHLAQIMAVQAVMEERSGLNPYIVGTNTGEEIKS